MQTKIKCVVWDLDNTIWHGILSEGDELSLNEDAVKTIEILDKRGILQSISSKNDFEPAKEALIKFGIWDYFIYSQINWGPKSEAINRIAKCINIGIDTLAFIDDSKFELEEVSFTYPQVKCIDAEDLHEVCDMDCMIPRFNTSDSAQRRKMYQCDIRRNEMEEHYEGPKEEFLRALEMKFTISRAKETDIQRLEELTVRTHQLNSTGYTFSYDEILEFIKSEDYEVIVAQLDDKFGTYGKIGLAIIHKFKDYWEMKLLLMSCRVTSKGVGNIFLNYLINMAYENGVRFRAQFIPTDRNRNMYITFKFNGFKEIEKQEELIIFEYSLTDKRPMPDYAQISMG
jgi:FkbH-like protein